MQTYELLHRQLACRKHYGNTTTLTCRAVKAWAFSVMSGVVSRSLLGHRETISALAARVATERLHGVADITATEAAPPQQSSAVASLVCGSLGDLLHSSCSPMKLLLEGMLERQRLPPSREVYIYIYCYILVRPAFQVSLQNSGAV